MKMLYFVFLLLFVFLSGCTQVDYSDVESECDANECIILEGEKINLNIDEGTYEIHLTHVNDSSNAVIFFDKDRGREISMPVQTGIIYSLEWFTFKVDRILINSEKYIVIRYISLEDFDSFLREYKGEPLNHQFSIAGSYYDWDNITISIIKEQDVESQIPRYEGSIEQFDSAYGTKFPFDVLGVEIHKYLHNLDDYDEFRYLWRFENFVFIVTANSEKENEADQFVEEIINFYEYFR